MIKICLALVVLVSLNGYIVDGRSTHELSHETQRLLNQLSKKIKTLSYAAPQYQNELPQTPQPTPYNVPAPVAKPQYQKPAIPQYQPPTPQYQTPKPHYQAPKPEYQAPKPQYQTPKPEYQPPTPQYQAPKPHYQAQKPEYQVLTPEYQAPKPEYQALKPEYQTPKPEYQPPTPEYQAPKPHYQPPTPEYQAPKPEYQAPKPQTLPYGQPNNYYSSGSSYSANECNGRPVDTKFPNPSNPNQFFVCTEDGSLVSMYCPDALVFSTITGRCEYSLQGPFGCESSPCQYNGVCVNNGGASYTCNCAPGYSGPNCEQVSACSSNSCDGGVCVSMPAGSPVTNYCLCSGGSRYGVDCSTAVENPCLGNGGGSLLLPSHINPALFAQCEGYKLYVKFCSFPLVFNAAIQRCDWSY